MLVKGKVALVTGGGSGIGLACIEEMLRNGISGVAVVDIDEQNGIATMIGLNGKYGQGKVIFVKANVASKHELEGAFKKTVETFKHLDIFFNNAGILTENNYERTLDVNIKGAVHGLKLAIDHYLPKYKSGKDAIIINTASAAGIIPFNGMEIYSTTKFAMIGLTRNFGCDYHYNRTGVKVVAICPTAVGTPLLDAAVRGLVYTDKEEEVKQSTTFKFQTSEQLAKCFLRVVERESNGSLWLIADGKETPIECPELFK